MVLIVIYYINFQVKEQKEQKEQKDVDEGTNGGETEDISDEEADIYETITVDGTEYQLNKDDKTVIRVDDFTPVGVWNTETESIDFDEDEDE